MWLLWMPLVNFGLAVLIVVVNAAVLISVASEKRLQTPTHLLGANLWLANCIAAVLTIFHGVSPSASSSAALGARPGAGPIVSADWRPSVHYRAPVDTLFSQPMLMQPGREQPPPPTALEHSSVPTFDALHKASGGGNYSNNASLGHKHRPDAELDDDSVEGARRRRSLLVSGFVDLLEMSDSSPSNGGGTVGAQHDRSGGGDGGSGSSSSAEFRSAVTPPSPSGGSPLIERNIVASGALTWRGRVLGPHMTAILVNSTASLLTLLGVGVVQSLAQRGYHLSKSQSIRVASSVWLALGLLLFLDFVLVRSADPLAALAAPFHLALLAVFLVLNLVVHPVNLLLIGRCRPRDAIDSHFLLEEATTAAVWLLLHALSFAVVALVIVWEGARQAGWLDGLELSAFSLHCVANPVVAIVRDRRLEAAVARWLFNVKRNNPVEDELIVALMRHPPPAYECALGAPSVAPNQPPMTRREMARTVWLASRVQVV